MNQRTLGGNDTIAHFLNMVVTCPMISHTHACCMLRMSSCFIQRQDLYPSLGQLPMTQGQRFVWRREHRCSQANPFGPCRRRGQRQRLEGKVTGDE